MNPNKDSGASPPKHDFAVQYEFLCIARMTLKEANLEGHVVLGRSPKVRSKVIADILSLLRRRKLRKLYQEFSATVRMLAAGRRMTRSVDNSLSAQ